MAKKLKYAANEALKVIDGPLASELAIHRFNERNPALCSNHPKPRPI